MFQLDVPRQLTSLTFHDFVVIVTATSPQKLNPHMMPQIHTCNMCVAHCRAACRAADPTATSHASHLVSRHSPSHPTPDSAYLPYDIVHLESAYEMDTVSHAMGFNVTFSQSRAGDAARR